MTNYSVIELGDISVQNNEGNDIDSENTEQVNDNPNDFNIQSEIAEEESVNNTNKTIIEDENLVQEYKNNLMKDMMQEYNND